MKTYSPVVSAGTRVLNGLKVTKDRIISKPFCSFICKGHCVNYVHGAGTTHDHLRQFIVKT